MSSGQRPRWKSYFPKMKDRGKYRRRAPRITLYDQHWNPIWPPVIICRGQSLRMDKGELVVTGRVLDKRTGYWMERERGDTA